LDAAGGFCLHCAGYGTAPKITEADASRVIALFRFKPNKDKKAMTANLRAAVTRGIASFASTSP